MRITAEVMKETLVAKMARDFLHASLCSPNRLTVLESFALANEFIAVGVDHGEIEFLETTKEK